MSKSILSIAVILLVSSLLQSCAEKMTFENSTVVPAAQGSIKIKKDGNNNYDINLSTMHLAEPTRLSPSKSFYVVWMNTEQNGTKNIGQLKTSSSLLSSTLKSSLKIVFVIPNLLSAIKKLDAFGLTVEKRSAEYHVL